MLKKEPEDGQVHDWGEVTTHCMGSRFVPLPPPAFEAMMVAGMAREEAEAGTGFRFTNGKDATAVCICATSDQGSVLQLCWKGECP